MPLFGVNDVSIVEPAQTANVAGLITLYNAALAALMGY